MEKGTREKERRVRVSTSEGTSDSFDVVVK
jgi:hypothetical protein